MYLVLSLKLGATATLYMIHTHAGAGTSQGGNDGDLPPLLSPSANEFFTQFLGNQRAMEDTLRLIA